MTGEPYDPSPIEGWGVKVLAKCGYWRRKPPRIVLIGPCPRCKDADGIDEWIPEETYPNVLKVEADDLDAVTMEEVSRVKLTEDTLTEFVRCQCHVAHDTTGKNKGCGAQGRVPVVVAS